jgi:hypothetical protein
MAESDKLAAAELGDGYGEDNAHCGKLKELLEKMDVSTTYTSPVCKHFVLGHHRKRVPGGEAHFLALLPFVNLDYELCLKAFGKIPQMFSACRMIKSLYYVLPYICSNFQGVGCYKLPTKKSCTVNG